MDKVIAQILGLSSKDEDLQQLKTFLSKAEETILRSPHQIDEALNVLDPHNHTLGYLYLLAVKAILPRPDQQVFITQVQGFLQTCNPAQVALSTFKFAKVCRAYATVLVELHQPIRGVGPLRKAIAALSKPRGSPLGNELTGIHTDFIQLCLLSKCYRAALPVLDEEAFEVNPDGSGVSVKDVLCYYYYGSLVYIGMKQYRKALEFLKLVFSIPAAVISAVMVESYKKFILVSLLETGSIVALPKYTSGVIHRYIKRTAEPYHDFATAYINYTKNPSSEGHSSSSNNNNPAPNSLEEIHRVAAQHVEVFQKDGNLGIVKQCIQSIYATNIKRHTQTYLTLSLKDIAESVKLPTIQDAQKAVLRMIENGEVHAQINQRDGMVAFEEDPEQYDTNSMMVKLDDQIKKIMTVDRRLRAVDNQIALTPLFVQKMMGHESRDTDASYYQRSIAHDDGRSWEMFR
eukprot:TRINITY_DN1779_c0_g1_i4.p1 TRINITY_DN1779_c0_g1~~TRINITY_DN1779_c0_g1_i4.p1  ORF type:complete len:459 (+),score=102.08 TRINITY_DN1779_c0_g1_i4:186-1562(+)